MNKGDVYMNKGDVNKGDVYDFMLLSGREETSIILCFYRQDAENFKENHKIIDVPFFSSMLGWQNWGLDLENPIIRSLFCMFNQNRVFDLIIGDVGNK